MSPTIIASSHDGPLEPVLWIDAEPARLTRDLAEVPSFAPQLVYQVPEAGGLTHGGWLGVLPRWPFDRAEPGGLVELLGDVEFKVCVSYPAAYPMVPPRVYPLDPEPELHEHSQSVWHVTPSGALCLLQSDGDWRPEASITELLAKASGWRVEYALMKVGAIERMSVSGIASDASYDHLVAEAAGSPRAAAGSGTEGDAHEAP